MQRIFMKGFIQRIFFIPVFLAPMAIVFITHLMPLFLVKGPTKTPAIAGVMVIIAIAILAIALAQCIYNEEYVKKRKMAIIN